LRRIFHPAQKNAGAISEKWSWIRSSENRIRQGRLVIELDPPADLIGIFHHGIVPLASISMTVVTSNRRSRIHGTPPILFASTLIHVKRKGDICTNNYTS
jgi:hypothetical protein